MTDIPNFPDIPEGGSKNAIIVRHQNHFTLTVFHPDLDEKTRTALLARTNSDLNTAQAPSDEKWSLISAAGRPELMFFTVIMPGASISITGGNLPVFPIVFGSSYLGAAALVWANRRAFYRDKSKKLNLAELAGSSYIRAQWLTEEHAGLLAKAVSNIEIIREAEVTKKDLIDSAKVEIRLPRILWDIAHTLHEITTLRDEAKQSGADAKSPQMRALDLAMQPVRKRVIALDTCAAQVKEADAKYAELKRQQRLNGMDDRIMDLLARASVDDPALEEIRDLSAQATAAADAFQAALNTALDSVNTALALDA